MPVLRPAVVCALGLALVTLGSVGCTAGTMGEDFDLAGQKGDGGHCSPGDTQSCICLGGGQGTQTCRASGASFGPCAGCGGELPDGLSTVDMAGTGCGDCTGCCNGKTCVPLNTETDGTCGLRGQTCAACTGGKVCGVGTGKCVDPGAGCGACGTGCCGAATNNVCLIEEPSACGPSCTACPFGVICNNGVCLNEIDSNAYFKVYVKSAKVLVNTTNCIQNWDDYPFISGTPDPMVCIEYQQGGTLYEGCSQSVSDTLSATYDDTTGLVTAGGSPFLVPASVITTGKMQISFYDDDSLATFQDDLMAQNFFPAKTTLEPMYSTGAFGCAMDITFQLR